MDHRILGVDPGTLRLGYGIVEGGKRPRLLDGGVCTAAPGVPVAQRLARLQAALREVIERWRPAAIAMESSFHGRNSQALLRLGEARGMVIGLAGSLALPVHDYTPAMIKQAVTGRGNASKEAVARMVHGLLPGLPAALPLDATDALAAALCHCHRSSLLAVAAPGAAWGSRRRTRRSRPVLLGRRRPHGRPR